MTKDITLDAKIRTKFQDKGEDKENIQGILYGRGIQNVMVSLNKKKFNDTYEEIGDSTVFELALDGKDKRNVLIKEIQRDVLSGAARHVDFYQVRMDEEIETEVELVFEGETPVVKESGGILVKNMDAIQVKCLPGDLPPEIKVDISKILTFDDYIYVKDLPVSEKVELLVDPETVVAMVSEPRSEEELADLETEVKEDVTKVEGVMKEEAPAEGEEAKSEEKKEEKK
ncbi:MAG TPA: 50S ribosomal protein L25 [Candidatus Bathyarchaeia archaeon]|nr:50S ribosomal protein L25 [Candidatus Bathyarchaeia archaeon]